MSIQHSINARFRGIITSNPSNTDNFISILAYTSWPPITPSDPPGEQPSDNDTNDNNKRRNRGNVILNVDPNTTLTDLLWLIEAALRNYDEENNPEPISASAEVTQAIVQLPSHEVVDYAAPSQIYITEANLTAVLGLLRHKSGILYVEVVVLEPHSEGTGPAGTIPAEPVGGQVGDGQTDDEDTGGRDTDDEETGGRETDDGETGGGEIGGRETNRGHIGRGPIPGGLIPPGLIAPGQVTRRKISCGETAYGMAAGGQDAGVKSRRKRHATKSAEKEDAESDISEEPIVKRHKTGEDAGGEDL